MRIHFIGIGGIGVSALAKYYLSQDHQVSGSDLAQSEITDQLQKMGARVYIGPHKSANLCASCARPGLTRPDLVVYSPAVTPENPELKTAKKQGVKCQSYPQALGELTKKYFTIAVCGTHGKGTTTAMISLILIKAGLDPTVIVGTKLKEFNDSNFRQGKSHSRGVRRATQYLIIEADEYKSSFLNYWPKIIVLTTIDKDHLDYFKTLNNILKTFGKFVGHLPKEGYLVANTNEKNTKSPMSNVQCPMSNYQSPKPKETEKLRKVLKIPGEHILADALAALAVARILKIPDKTSFEALGEYRGAWRRFEESELKIGNCKLKIVSDYAHHPTEIAVTLKAVREKYPKRQIWCVFQPHQYQRTYYLFDDFVKALANAPVDKLILTDIYSVAGRESQAIRKKISSKILAEAIKSHFNKEIIYLPSIKNAAEYLKKNLQGGEVLVIMGAGDIYKLPEQF